VVGLRDRPEPTLHVLHRRYPAAVWDGALVLTHGEGK